MLAKEFQTKQSEIKKALVLGEHGDSMVPIFSIAKLNNKPVLELLNNSQVDKITKDLRDYWKILRKFKGPSIFGSAKNIVDVIKAIIKNEVLSIPASVMLDGEYGLTDICLGVPVRINKEGIIQIQEIDLQKSELESLKQSADVIRKYLYQKQTAS